MDLKKLIRKYSQPGPRYTSYPTVPQWSTSVGQEALAEKLRLAPQNEPYALYIHIPFCRELCYYCGCNMKITSKPEVSRPYLESLRNEMLAVSRHLGFRPKVEQISLGGGTPTFLTPAELTKLFSFIQEHFEIEATSEISIEVDPRVTTLTHLQTLRSLGFNRISLGVQDFSDQVQKAVNRIQPAPLTHQMLKDCRALGFGGINFDLMYGLPYQTLESFQKTVDQVVEMKPDRIALYNYAHLPKMIKHQIILDPLPRPLAQERMDIFEHAFFKLTSSGYQSVGMDHFALESDELYQALKKGALYRNFMGYTVKRGANMIGLGMSAISEIGGGFFQNLKATPDYEKETSQGKLPTWRGCLLTIEDEKRKWIIQKLMCKFQLSYEDYHTTFGGHFLEEFKEELSRLQPLEEDGLLTLKKDKIEVSSLGRLFIRNAAMVFDTYLNAQNNIYSKTV